MTSPLTVVVVTSRLHHYAQALRDELERHRGSNARCFDNNTIFLAAGDPQRGIGSGITLADTTTCTAYNLFTPLFIFIIILLCLLGFV